MTETKTFNRHTACAFTGRRPQSLPWGYDETGPGARGFAACLQNEINKAYADGYRTFLCGMAQGIDLMACELTIQLQLSDIKIIAALPGKNQTRSWPFNAVKRYENCLSHCHDIYYAAELCSSESYHRRNRWMVDNASRLIAVWEGNPTGGAGRTAQYAAKQGVEVVRLWP